MAEKLALKKALFDELKEQIRTLTDDIQTIFSNNIDERFQLPFTSNILHIKKL